MGVKVTFTVPEKIIYVHTSPVTDGSDQVVDIDIKQDLYSDGKEDWLTGGVLTGFDFPVRSVGGDPLPGSKSLGATFFLRSDWKIRPYEGSHILRINGNLYSEDGASPFTQTEGIFNVTIISTVSSLVDSTVQQLAELEYISFGGQVSIDMYNNSGNAIEGTDYPAGNMEYPCLHTQDATTIAHDRGFKKLGIRGNLLLGEGDNVSGYTLVGENPVRTTVTALPISTTFGVEFKECKLTGTLDGYSTVRDCMIEDLDYINGYVYNSILSYVGTIRLGGGTEAHFIDCVSSKPGVGTPTIDCGGSGQALAMREYNGGILLINKTGPESISIDLQAGQIRLDPATFTGGVLVARGDGKVVNHDTDVHIHNAWNGCTILNETNHPLCTARAVWIAHLEEYTTVSGSAAEALVSSSGVTQEDMNVYLDNYPNKDYYTADLTTLHDPSLNEISNAVWTDINATQLMADLAFIKGIEGGRWEIIANQMIFYNDDNITEIARFNLYNSAGVPAEENIYKRVRV